jgi:Polyketide cyclase / dehydrase and lipid transport
MPAATITSAIDVDETPADVYDLLDDLGAHRSFTDHYITDWELSGPARGAGGTARVKVKGARSEITVVESTPTRIVEHGHGGPRGRFRTTGTYELAAREGGGTHITFTNTIDAPTAFERWIAGTALRRLQADNDRALERLRERLAQGAGTVAA